MASYAEAMSSTPEGGPDEAAAALVVLRAIATPDNAVFLHNALAAEALYLFGQANKCLPFPVVKPEQQAEEDFNLKIDNLRKRLTDYAETLHQMSNEMFRAAHHYGHAEADIIASFTAFYADHQLRTLGRGPNPIPGLDNW
jgi:hypothetical protein